MRVRSLALLLASLVALVLSGCGVGDVSSADQVQKKDALMKQAAQEPGGIKVEK